MDTRFKRRATVSTMVGASGPRGLIIGQLWPGGKVASNKIRQARAPCGPAASPTTRAAPAVLRGKPKPGLEPGTYALRKHRSTIELLRHLRPEFVSRSLPWRCPQAV